jgi:hypothetical protein
MHTGGIAENLKVIYHGGLYLSSERGGRIIVHINPFLRHNSLPLGYRIISKKLLSLLSVYQEIFF